MSIRIAHMATLLLTTILAISCGNSHSQSGNTSATSVSTTSANNCLLTYADKLDQLLTAADAVAITGKPEAAMETKYSKVLKNTEYHEIFYKWPAEGRTKLYNGIKVPQGDMVVLGSMKKMTEEEFTAQHTARTQEEIQHTQETMNSEMDKALEGQSSSDKANKAAKKLNDMGVEKSTTKAVTATIGGVFAKIAAAYVPVSGVGDAATWNSESERLYVLTGGVKFELGVNISDDTTINKEATITLAKKLLSKCN